ncbi:hypothetical protein [Bradyrhizobium elkanii]|uniref:hypothetical protein n=1 Tax=Bradyrhizobium elkanii TaxID=29448 RepID=UPI0035156D39
MSKLLINESPLQVLPSLAVAVGLNEAIVLQQVHYWLARSTTDKGGHRWVYNTIPQWQEQFPFWSADTVRRTLASLKDAGLLVAETLSDNRFDKTMFYRIDYDRLRAIEDGILQPSEHGNVPSSEAATAGDDIDRTETTTEKSKKTRSASTPKATFNYETGKVEQLADSVVEKWQAAYPAIDVRAEIARAEAWLLANPKNRKSDLPRFLNNWLNRAQDRAPRAGGSPQPGRSFRPRPQTSFSGNSYSGTPDDEIPWLRSA